MKKFAFNNLRPETKARYEKNHQKALIESAPRKIAQISKEISEAENDGESIEYIGFLREKLEKQKKLLELDAK